MPVGGVTSVVSRVPNIARTPPGHGPLAGRPCAGGPAKEGWALNTCEISCRSDALQHHVGDAGEG